MGTGPSHIVDWRLYDEDPGPYNGGDGTYFFRTSRISKPSKIPRQAPADDGFVAVPSTYGAQDSSPSPGTVVGIALGSVAAFLILLFLFYWVLHRTPLRFGPLDDEEKLESRSAVGPVSPPRPHRRPSSRRKRERRGKKRVSETAEVRSYERISPAESKSKRHRSAETVIVEPPMPPPPRPPPAPESSVLPVSEEDEIVVVEEHTPPPTTVRRETTRGYRRQSSGYRDVDPARFAGGDEPVRHMRRSSGRHGRR